MRGRARATGVMRPPWAVLLILAALAPGVLAQPHHEDFSRAVPDEAMVALVGGMVVSQWTAALEGALELQHDAARQRGGDAGNLSRAMLEASRLAAPSATTPGRLQARAPAAHNLTANLTRLVDDWASWDRMQAEGLQTAASVLRGRLLVSAMERAVEGGRQAADAHEALGHDVADLRAALDRFAAALDAAILRVASFPGGDEGAAALYLEAIPREVKVTGEVVLRGALLDRDHEGRPVSLAVDGVPWGVVLTDRHGLFSLARPVLDLPLGEHAAVAHAESSSGAPLASGPAAFTVVGVPTRLTLFAPSARIPVDAAFELAVRLVDEEGRPVSATVQMWIDDALPVDLALAPDGTGRVPVQARDLGLGGHVARARYAGDALHAPSAARATFEIVVPGGADAPGAGAYLPWAIVLALLVLHLAVLAHLRAARSRLFLPLLVAGPIALALVQHALMRVPAHALAVAAADLLLGLALLPLSRLAGPAPPAPLPGPAPGPAAAADLPAGPSAAAPDAPQDPLHELVALYRVLPRRLAAEGVATGPLTHREVAAALRARRLPEEPIRALTRALERALYAGALPAPDELPALRAAAATLEASA